MKQGTLIAIVIGVVIVGAAALVALNMSAPSAGNVTSPTPPPVKTATDVLERFDLLKQKVNASGMWFGGAAVQLINAEETAMVYIYRPVGSNDATDLVSGGFSALYDVFQAQDPLLVGLIDTTRKVSDQQYKVDVYAMERPLVELYAVGNITKAEMVKKALTVTADTVSLRANGTPVKQAPALPKPAGNYTPPADRKARVAEMMNRTGHQLLNLQEGATQDGGRAVSLAYSIPADLANAAKYDAIEAGMRICAGAYGDYDRYYLSLISEKGDQYYVVDAGRVPVLDYVEGAITQDQLYRNINLTYYTR